VKMNAQREEANLIKGEMLSRVTVFYGDEGAAQICDAFVVVVGLGGVGSHAANMLVRSGVSRIRLIDFDQVTLSSLNRHACATLDDVGRSKASVMQAALHRVAPWCEIEAITEMFRGSDADRLVGSGSPTYVLDCIDDVSTKAELIAYCIKNNIKLLASLGAGGKADPTRLRVAPLSECINDPLASKIKWKLKKYNISPEQVMSVFSIEKPMCNLMPLDDDQKASPQDFGAVDYLRLRVMPVLGTSPAIFGQAMASFVLCQVAGREYVPEACERLSKNLKHKLREMLKRNEIQRFGSGRVDGAAILGVDDEEGVDIDDDDVEFVVQLVWQGRCSVSGKRFGGHAPLVLTRWNALLPPTPSNLVLMILTSANLLLKPENIGPDGIPTCFPAEYVVKVNKRLAWAKTLCSEALVYGSCGMHTAAPTSANLVGSIGNASKPKQSSINIDPIEAFLDKSVRDAFTEIATALGIAFVVGFFISRNNR